MKRLFSVFIPLALVVGLALPVSAEEKATGATLVSKPGKTLEPATKRGKNDGKIVVQKPAAKSQVQKEVLKLADQYKAFRARQAQIVRSFAIMHNSTSYGETGQPMGSAPLTQEEIRLPAIVSQLQAIKIMLECQTDSGTGDLQYWIRTECVLNRQGQTTVTVLNGMIQNDGAAMHPLLRAALSIVANSLNSSIHVNDKASGDSNFWCNASAFTRDALHTAATNIGQLLSSLPCPQPGDCTSSLTGTLWVLENFLQANEDSGTGSPDFWLRTQSLLCVQATGAANALDNLSRLNISPLARIMLQNESNSLRSASTRYSGATGDANFWMNASGVTLNALHTTANNLRNFRQSL
ncbi:MAG: hypothetical protein WA705_16445 [Candidatus Ozemobacteraceae bacterium]